MTRRQQVFIDEYLNCWNASEAARRAGYSTKSAKFIGKETLERPEVAAEIERRITDRGVKAPEVLLRLTEQARGDIGQFFKESLRWSQWPLATDEILAEKEVPDPHHPTKQIKVYQCRRVVLDLTKLQDPASSRLVRKFADSARSGLNIELYDAQGALEKLGKALGVLRENVNMTQEGPIEIVTRIVRKHDGYSE